MLATLNGAMWTSENNRKTILVGMKESEEELQCSLCNEMLGYNIFEYVNKKN